MEAAGNDDAELVRRARRGDADAFAALVRRHERAMLALAYACTKDAATAADVVQDSVLRCWRKIADLREESRFASWLATTVRHLSINALRSPQRRMKLVSDATLDGHSAGDGGLDGLVRDDESRAMRAAIGTLDETSRAVLVLRYYDDLPSKQIAELLEMTPAAVDMKLSRARQALKAQLLKTDIAADHRPVNEPPRVARNP